MARSEKLKFDRRTALQAAATVSTAGMVASAGCLGNQASAINVEDPEELSDVESVTFGSAQSVGWILERLIEDPSAEGAILGSSFRTRGRVLANFSAEPARIEYADRLDWDSFSPANTASVSSLLSPIGWVSTTQTRATPELYADHKLLLIAGTTDDDQRFYTKYGITPLLPVRAPNTSDYTTGAAVSVEGVVNWSSQSSVAELFESGVEGGFVQARQVTQEGQGLPSFESVETGTERATLGLQHAEKRQLEAFDARCEYEYATEFPAPTGGSLVAQSGRVESVRTSEQGTVEAVELAVTDQEVLVGATDPTVERGTNDGTDADDEQSDGPGAGGADPAVSNIMTVVDTSGSMDETDARDGSQRIQVARESARALVSYVEQGNSLGVVGFDTSARTQQALTQIDGQASRAELTSAIDGLGAGGDTSITAGLEAGIDRLRQTDGQRAIVLLSDGGHNTGASPTTLISRLRSLGITVYSIGMGSANRDLLERLAQETGGRSAFAPRPGEIRALYQEFSTAAQRRATLTSRRTVLTEGQEQQETVTVDSSCQDVQFSLSYPGSRIVLTPQRPNGEPVDPSDEDVDHRVTETSDVWTISDPQTGDWEYQLVATQLSRPEQARVEVSANSPVQTDLFVSDDLYDETGLYKIELKAERGRQRYTGATVDVRVTPPSVATDTGTSASATASPTPNETSTGPATTDESGTPRPVTLSLRDDGGGPDPVGNDGVYTGYFHPSEPGTYQFEISMDGGQVGDLSRTFSRRITTSRSIDDPAVPYQSRGAAGDLPGGGENLPGAGLLGQFGPLIGFAGALGLIGLYFWRQITAPDYRGDSPGGPNE